MSKIRESSTCRVLWGCRHGEQDELWSHRPSSNQQSSNSLFDPLTASPRVSISGKHSLPCHPIFSTTPTILFLKKILTIKKKKKKTHKISETISMNITEKSNILGQISEWIDHNKDMSQKVHWQPINLRLILHPWNSTTTAFGLFFVSWESLQILQS